MYHTNKNLNIFSRAAGAALLLLSTLSACNKLSEQTPLSEPEALSPEAVGELTGSIRLDIALEEDAPVETRAVTAYQSVENYEKAVNRLDIFIFDKSSKKLNAHYTAASPTVSSDGKVIAEAIPCTQGIKHVFAVINGAAITGLDSIADEDAFCALTADLDYNSTADGGNFLMLARSADVSVSGNDVACTLTARRPVYRVVLQRVRNNTQIGTITVKGVFLINVGKTTLASQFDPTTLPKAASVAYNIAGKKTGSSAYVTGPESSDLPALLYKDLGNVSIDKNGSLGSNDVPLCRLYGIPHAAHGTSPERLVLLANVAGNDYYYPMTLPETVGNNSYTVELTIRNIGSQNPNLPVAVGDIDATVTLAPWITTNNLDISI